MSLGALNPIDSPTAWDTVTIAGVPSPGFCEYEGFVRKNEWDQKKGKGTLGATLTYTGRPAAEGSFTFFLWLSDQWAAWDAFYPLFKYDPTIKTAQAVDIFHPALAAVNISSVVVEDIGPPMKVSTGYYSITVKMLEYAPPPSASAVSTPTGAVAYPPPPGNAPGNTPTPAPDALQTQIAALYQQASAP